jgi:hypothetical protein
MQTKRNYWKKVNLKKSAENSSFSVNVLLLSLIAPEKENVDRNID